MYGKLFILCLTCIMCLASGCAAKKNTSEPMTEVVVIQNSTSAAFAESADAATEMAENSVKESKAAGTSVSPFVEDMNYDIKDFIRQYYDYLAVARCGVTTTLGAQVVIMLDAFYVCTNESGTYYICGGSVGDEVKSYNSIMLSDQKIAGVEKEVRLDNAAAVINQENLKEVAGIVINDGVRRYLYEQPAAE